MSRTKVRDIAFLSDLKCENVSLSATVGIPERIREIRCHGNEADGCGVNVDILTDHALMVAVGLVNGVPVAVVVKSLDTEGLEHAAGESEGGEVIVAATVERCGNVEHVGVAVGEFAVKVAVDYETEGGDVGLFVKGICDGAVAHAKIAVVVAPDLALHAVVQHRRIAPVCAQLSRERKGRDGALEAGQEAVVFKQTRLDLADAFLANFTRQHAMLNSVSGGSTDGLSHNAAGAHNTGCAECNVGAAYVASCEHKVVNVLGIEGTEGNTVGLGEAALLQMTLALSAHVEAAGQVVVDLPAAVRNCVGELTARLNVVLGDNVIANVSAAFALSGQEADKVELPVVCAVVALILDVIPNAKGDLEKLIASLFGVAKGINHTAKLNPIEVCVYLVKTFVGLEVHFFVCVICVRPDGRNVLYLVVGLVSLDHKAHAHGMAVRYLKAKLLAKGVLGLTAYHIFGVGDLCKNAVSRAIHENISFNGVPCVCGELESGYALDVTVGGVRIANGAVENKLDVGLGHHLAVKKGIPKGKISVFVAIHIIQQYFFHDACFLQITNSASGAGHPHSYLGGGISSQHGSVLDEDNARTASCGAECAKSTGETAAYDTNICLV